MGARVLGIFGGSGMNTGSTMPPEERSIRDAVRQQYREEGNTENPYLIGTAQAIFWTSEEHRIWIESMEAM
jgi:hypothetical protein